MGVGLRHPHYRQIIEDPPTEKVSWLEVHPENYFGGGINYKFLEKIREDFPISFHGVGLSLGSAQPVNVDHVQQLKKLIDLIEPFQFSDHAAWSMSGNAHLNDLMPLAYTDDNLDNLCRNIDYVQNTLGQQILIENPSTYMRFTQDEMTEWEFLNSLVSRSECALLLDINNIVVQAKNHGFSAHEYIDNINFNAVKEMHLAGYTKREIEGQTLYLDTHGEKVHKDVWQLFEYTMSRYSAVHTLIEWDNDIPSLDVLFEEAKKAKSIIDQTKERRCMQNDAAE
ncbi:MAG: hypothetical protein CL561_08745 [Alphaproteobacteria bacterium]|nr:hypothetical protein [Alphaproteobacteria bacterium]|tara:strand:+ start:7557 stop:8402 length:846 start_codon:yes stop_codon:yes gene_type:complete